MPTTVRDLLGAAGLAWHSSVPWGTKPALDLPGLYLVSHSADPEAADAPATCRLAGERVAELHTVRPEVTVAGLPADAISLAAALLAMWPSGESVVYIGLAGTSVADRVGRYYSTRIGARSPHAGGWPIKMLADLDNLHVHVAAAADPNSAEESALRAFIAGVNKGVRSGLCDPALPLPFANLELTKGVRKRHGIQGARARRPASRPAAHPPGPSTLSSTHQSKVAYAMAYSINVTAADVASGQIRVTQGPKAALALPRVKTTVSLTVRGEPMTVAWDPRLGPDKERSGLLRIGREAATLLFEAGSGSLSIDRDESGLLYLR